MGKTSTLESTILEDHCHREDSDQIPCVHQILPIKASALPSVHAPINQNPTLLPPPLRNTKESVESLPSRAPNDLATDSQNTTARNRFENTTRKQLTLGIRSRWRTKLGALGLPKARLVALGPVQCIPLGKVSAQSPGCSPSHSHGQLCPGHNAAAPSSTSGRKEKLIYSCCGDELMGAFGSPVQLPLAAKG